MTDRLLTTREVAAFLGLSRETVLRRYRRDELPGYRLASNVLRFRESEIEAWLQHHNERSRLTGDSIPEYIPGKETREGRNQSERTKVGEANVGESSAHG
jgi:excisionase family DNA binding protein